MTFYSLSFLFFFLLFTFLLGIIRTPKVQQILFLCANVIFYGFWDYRFLLLLFGIITLCYSATLLYSKKQNQLFIYMAVLICILTLGIFKYFNFFAESFSKLFRIRDSITLNLILPLGISFYIFQAISYLFDVLQGKIDVVRDYLKLATYISFFPQITSGPIVKAHFFLPQLDRIHYVKKLNVYEGVQKFLMGLTKKVVFADRIGVAVDAVYQAPLAYNGISVFMAVVGYAFQIYCDFSGYSDMAIGIAKVWDFDLGENFNMPYLAKNPSDFWRRWHISLSTWFRDYVYIPLGGSKRGRTRTYFNLFITMVLSGIWHGANITFIIWGVFHGMLSALHKMVSDFTKSRDIKVVMPNWIKIVLTFCLVSLLWVLFRANSIGQAGMIIKSLTNTEGIMYINVYVVVYVLLLICINCYVAMKNNGKYISLKMDLGRFKNKVVIALWIWLIVLFMYYGNSAFIYANF